MELKQFRWKGGDEGDKEESQGVCTGNASVLALVSFGLLSRWSDGGRLRLDPGVCRVPFLTLKRGGKKTDVYSYSI